MCPGLKCAFHLNKRHTLAPGTFRPRDKNLSFVVLHDVVKSVIGHWCQWLQLVKITQILIFVPGPKRARDKKKFSFAIFTHFHDPRYSKATLFMEKGQFVTCGQHLWQKCKLFFSGPKRARGRNVPFTLTKGTFRTRARFGPGTKISLLSFYIM